MSGDLMRNEEAKHCLSDMKSAVEMIAQRVPSDRHGSGGQLSVITQYDARWSLFPGMPVSDRKQDVDFSKSLPLINGLSSNDFNKWSAEPFLFCAPQGLDSGKPGGQNLTRTVVFDANQPDTQAAGYINFGVSETARARIRKVNPIGIVRIAQRFRSRWQKARCRVLPQ
jgi:hypothetical protein